MICYNGRQLYHIQLCDRSPGEGEGKDAIFHEFWGSVFTKKIEIDLYNKHKEKAGAPFCETNQRYRHNTFKINNKEDDEYQCTFSQLCK